MLMSRPSIERLLTDFLQTSLAATVGFTGAFAILWFFVSGEGTGEARFAASVIILVLFLSIAWVIPVTLLTLLAGRLAVRFLPQSILKSFTSVLLLALFGLGSGLFVLWLAGLGNIQIAGAYGMASAAVGGAAGGSLLGSRLSR